MLHALILSVSIGERLLSDDSSTIIARWTGVDPAFGSRTRGRGAEGWSHPPAAVSSCWFSCSAMLLLDRAAGWCVAVLLWAAGWWVRACRCLGGVAEDVLDIEEAAASWVSVPFAFHTGTAIADTATIAASLRRCFTSLILCLLSATGRPTG